MKRRLFSVAAAVLLLSALVFAFGTGTAHADSNDPYDSGCANTGYPANSGSLSVAGYTVYAQNWYSTGCNTNWALIWWTGGSAVQTRVEIYNSNECQSYPTGCLCAGTNCLYSGGLSPSWTDMIDGTQTAYVSLVIKANGQTARSPNLWLPA